MSWLCKKCETVNEDCDSRCVVCNSVSPIISDVTIDYNTSSIIWNSENVEELILRYSRGTFNITGLTSFTIDICTVETLIFVARNEVAEREFQVSLSQQEVESVIRAKQIEAKQKELSAWREACRLDNIGHYEAFLKEFPDSPHVDEAKNCITRLRDDNRWAASCRKNTLEAYRLYQTYWPKGRHIVDCNRIIDEILDTRAWNAALKRFTIEGFYDYLSHFQHGIHKEEANKIIRRLRRRKSLKEFFVFLFICLACFAAIIFYDSWTPILNRIYVDVKEIILPARSKEQGQEDPSLNPPDNPAKFDTTEEIKRIRNRLDESIKVLRNNKRILDSYESKNYDNYRTLKKTADDLAEQLESLDHEEGIKYKRILKDLNID